MRKATAEEESDVRVLIQVHNDDATMVNPIGSKKGDHKYSVLSGGVVNLPLKMRLSFNYLLLLGVVSAQLLKQNGGIGWALCGINADGREVVRGYALGPRRARQSFVGTVSSTVDGSC